MRQGEHVPAVTEIPTMNAPRAEGGSAPKVVVLRATGPTGQRIVSLALEEDYRFPRVRLKKMSFRMSPRPFAGLPLGPRHRL